MSRSLALAAVALCVSAAPAGATLVGAFSLDDLATVATHVVRGEVVDIESGWQDGLIFTEVEITVAECLKGPCETRSLVLRVLGGKTSKYVQDVDGSARFGLGEEVVLFLEPTADHHLRPIGMAQGKFTLTGGVAVRGEVAVAGPRTAAALRLNRVPADTLMRAIRTALVR